MRKNKWIITLVTIITLENSVAAQPRFIDPDRSKLLVREIAGVKLRPTSALILNSVEKLYQKPVYIVFRDDLGEGVAGYSDTRAPVLGIARGEGQNEENVIHELFHLKMQAEGYPLFDFEMSAPQPVLRGDMYKTFRELIYDPITHAIFYPKMREMGLDPDANTRAQLIRNRVRAKQPGIALPSKEWRATYLMKISLETRDSESKVAVERWYEEKGWDWPITRGKALFQIVATASTDSAALATVVVSCFNELFGELAEFRVARAERRKYGSATKVYVVIRVTPRL